MKSTFAGLGVIHQIANLYDICSNLIVSVIIIVGTLDLYHLVVLYSATLWLH